MLVLVLEGTPPELAGQLKDEGTPNWTRTPTDHRTLTDGPLMDESPAAAVGASSA
jgi:hypothetical protein